VPKQKKRAEQEKPGVKAKTFCPVQSPNGQPAWRSATGSETSRSHYGGERRERDEEKARRLVAEHWQGLGWSGAELAQRRKGDPEKVALARRLGAETTMSLKWIASELRMGSWTYVSNLLGQPAQRRGKGGADPGLSEGP